MFCIAYATQTRKYLYQNATLTTLNWIIAIITTKHIITYKVVTCFTFYSPRQYSKRKMRNEYEQQINVQCIYISRQIIFDGAEYFFLFCI